MAKLLFEDDDGKQREIKLSSISKKALKKDDTLVAYYEVGKLSPPHTVNTILNNLKIVLENMFECKVVVVAMREGVKDIELNIINKKE